MKTIQIDFSVFFESFVQAICWFMLLLERPKDERPVFKKALIFAGLYCVILAIRSAVILIYNHFGYQTLYVVPITMYIMYALLGFVFLRLFSRHKKTTTMLIVSMMFASITSLNTVGGQLSYLAGVFVKSGFPEALARCIMIVFLIPVVFYFIKLNFDAYDFIPTKGILMLIIGDVVLMILSIMEGYPRSKENVVFYIFLVAFFGIYLMILSEILALSAMCKERTEVMTLQAEKQRYAAEKELYFATESSLHDLRSIRHDLKNQYTYMGILLKENRYDELKDYFEKLTDHLPEQLHYVDCGNRSMNTNINMMFTKARRSNITIVPQLVVPPVLPFSDEDMCTLISNLLDNAIDECKHLKRHGASDPQIYLEIKPQGSYLVIICINPTDKTEIVKKSGLILTTKKDKKIHGYGTGIVSKTAEKYNGLAEFNIEEGKFVAKVMLDITGAQEKGKK